MSEPKLKTPKPFDISKRVVMEAFQKVKIASHEVVGIRYGYPSVMPAQAHQ